MDFSERLQALRKTKGLTQEGLGERVGVSRQAVQKWESGAANPDLDNLVALSDCLGVSLDYLLKGEEPSAPQARPAPVGYEFKSRRTLFGLPLVHIHLGAPMGRVSVARGVVAIGDVAVGYLALGGVAVGYLSFGGVSLGACALGGLTLGAVALGGVAIGYLAIGAAALGVYALGAAAVGCNAIGAGAVASGFAAGEEARGAVALGNNAEGGLALKAADYVGQADAVRALVLEKCPRIWRWFLELALRALL